MFLAALRDRGCPRGMSMARHRRGWNYHVAPYSILPGMKLCAYRRFSARGRAGGGLRIVVLVRALVFLQL